MKQCSLTLGSALSWVVVQMRVLGVQRRGWVDRVSVEDERGLWWIGRWVRLEVGYDLDGVGLAVAGFHRSWCC